MYKYKLVPIKYYILISKLKVLDRTYKTLNIYQ